MGKISSLPVSIATDNITCTQSEYTLKFAIGPTWFRPGPILLKHLDANVNFDLAMELLFLEMKENG